MRPINNLIMVVPTYEQTLKDDCRDGLKENDTEENTQMRWNIHLNVPRIVPALKGYGMKVLPPTNPQTCPGR